MARLGPCIAANNNLKADSGFHYEIKAIPTTYAGVRFRSRLEAKWAAFFDLAEIRWTYEPFDLEGWAPDFLLSTVAGDVLVEVKPVDLSLPPERLSIVYEKAGRHAVEHQVLLLGLGPMGDVFGIPIHKEDPSDIFVECIRVRDHQSLWRSAGNETQWNSGCIDDLQVGLRAIARGLSRARAA